MLYQLADKYTNLAYCYWARNPQSKFWRVLVNVAYNVRDFLR